MKSDDNNLPKILGIAFLLALILYVGTWKWIQHKREHKGPWRVIFQTDSLGVPSILVSQAFHKIDNVKIIFSEERVEPAGMVRPVSFGEPKKRVPFGELVFQDPTFLPGTVSFNFWGHDVELLPRTLVIDKQEIPWQSQTNIQVKGEGKFERRAVKKPAFL